MAPIKLRPHHLLDIVTNFEPDEDPGYERASGENGVREVTRLVTQGLDFEVEFIVGPDCICRPCNHRQADGQCDRMLERFDPPRPMDDYNDQLDRRIFDRLGIEPGAVMTAREFLEMANAHLPGLEQVYAQSRVRGAQRRDWLIQGMRALGVRGGSD